jgi:hypothetical protein
MFKPMPPTVGENSEDAVPNVQIEAVPYNPGVVTKPKPMIVAKSSSMDLEGMW